MAASETRTDTGGNGDRTNKFLQNVIVMRHGDRIDNFEPLWITHSPRPWDPILIEAGKTRAFTTGKKLRKLGYKIDRVFVSPFARCIQTAAEVIKALCAKNEDSLLDETSEKVEVDPSKIKASIEYGICEALSREAIKVELVPKDGNWFPILSELEAMLPAGTVDPSVKRVYTEMPKWEETLSDARHRYEGVFTALADKYPRENILIVTHGEGVGVAISAFMKDTVAYDVEYCAYSHLQRHISFSSSASFTAENLKAITKNGQTGIRYCDVNSLAPADV